MIKSNELKIRNLLKVNDLIVSISKIEYERFWGSFKDKLFFQSEEMQPIELTEEWLIKFGIKLMPESEYTMNTYDIAGFKLWRTNGKFLFNDKIEIKYVHQLQNIYFALTNKELSYV